MLVPRTEGCVVFVALFDGRGRGCEGLVLLSGLDIVRVDKEEQCRFALRLGCETVEMEGEGSFRRWMG